MLPLIPQSPTSNVRKHLFSQHSSSMQQPPSGSVAMEGEMEIEQDSVPLSPESSQKKTGRTNTPWTAEEERRLKKMRDARRTWNEIAKVCDN